MGDLAPPDDSTWHRVKWTDEMVRLLIAIIAFIGDDGPSSKKGKWKQISMLMSEKSFVVSPQQCEDKFSDLNKRYKRLNQILGRGISCDVVENPSLLDSMTHLSDNTKKTVIKILGSKQLFYREMCAYHNGQMIPNTENLEFPGISDARAANDGNKRESKENEENVVMDSENLRGKEQLGWIQAQAMRLEEERVEIERDRLQLEKQWMKWIRFRRMKEWEMERKELDNERMLLENQRMAIEVRCKVMELGRKSVREVTEINGGEQIEGSKVQ